MERVEGIDGAQKGAMAVLIKTVLRNTKRLFRHLRVRSGADRSANHVDVLSIKSLLAQGGLLVATMGLLIASSTSIRAEGLSLPAEPMVLEQTMVFRWSLIKVGEMDFSISLDDSAEHLDKRLVGDSDVIPGLGAASAMLPMDISITGVTRGPLRWVKDYVATASLTNVNNGSTFVLDGQDKGVAERREIFFRQGALPQMKFFSDSTAKAPLELQAKWGHDIVDPLTVFRWILSQALRQQSCDNQFWIYDGKRRYLATTTGLGSKPEVCRLTLAGSERKSQDNAQEHVGSSTSQSQSGDRVEPKGWSSIWPFGRKDREIDYTIEVCSERELVIRRIEMAAPIGGIFAVSKRACE